MKSIVSATAIASFLTTGCQNANTTQPDARTEEPVAYITTDELSSTLATERGVVLVEFCVPTGCSRCDEMREQIDRLAIHERERLTIRRVNLHQQHALARQLGVSVCPGYIAFCDGEEVFRAVYPTSSDLIVAGIDESLRRISSAE